MPRAQRAIENVDFKPSVFLDFPNKSMPKDFKDLSIDDEVMVVLRGKVKSISQHESTSSVSVEYDKLEIVAGAKPKTMNDVLEELQEGRKA